VLARRWRQPLGDVVSTVVTLDALVTIGQAIVYDIPRHRGFVDLIVIVIAILAPTIAAVLLWNARARRD